MVLNIVNYFHKVVIKITGFLDRTPSKLVKFHEQMALTPESMVGHRP